MKRFITFVAKRTTAGVSFKSIWEMCVNGIDTQCVPKMVAYRSAIKNDAHAKTSAQRLTNPN